MRLTLFSKALIVLLVCGVAGYGYVRFGRKPAAPAPGPGPEQHADHAAAPGSAPAPASAAPASPAGGRPRMVIGVNDFGGAYPGLVANDGATAGPDSCFAKAGLDVEIKLVRGSKERLEQFDDHKVDVMLLTLDYVANLVADYQKKGEALQTFLFVDWSRGNLGIVAKPSFGSIESLKTARIATTRNTPTHYFLLSLLDRSNLKPNEIELIKSSLVFAKKTPDTADMFQRGEVDAVAIWEPHLSKAMAAGGKKLVSTETATNLIADVLFARKSFLDEHAEQMPAFTRCWLEGAKKLKADPEAAVQLISKAFQQTPEETRQVLARIKPASFADNRAFFGLETEGSPYARLLTEAGEIWKREGIIDAVPEPKQVARTKFLEALKSEYTSEQVVEDWKFKAPQGNAEALLSRSVSIYFPSGSAELDANARRIIDQFAEQTVGVFQNAYVRIEGNTDTTGARTANIALSKQRAQAVADYLVTRHRFDAARFVAVGNGPDRPVGDNRTEQGREWNRRTDFRIVPNL